MQANEVDDSIMYKTWCQKNADLVLQYVLFEIPGVMLNTRFFDIHRPESGFISTRRHGKRPRRSSAGRKGAPLGGPKQSHTSSRTSPIICTLKEASADDHHRKCREAMTSL